MKKKGKLSASIMSVELDKLPYFLEKFRASNLEYIHLDITDGEFVPNLSIGTYYAKNLRKLTNIPFDYHFMVNNPLKKMKWFDIKKYDHVSFHLENNKNIPECIEYVKQHGASVFIAINPETDIHKLDRYFSEIDGVLIMHVSPGFSGSKMIPKTMDKVYELKNYFNKNKIDLDIKSDGNVTIENAKILYTKGTTIFVSGTGLVAELENITPTIDNFRKEIGWE